MSEIKSFLLYKEIIDTADELSDDQLGKLFRMILHQVNDREMECEDKLLRLVFKPISKTLSREHKKYENKLQERSQSGRTGNLKRWHPDIYEDFKKGNIDLDEAEKIVNDRKTSLSDKVIANVAVTVTDTVTVNENETVDDNDDENKEIDLNANGRYFLNNKNSEVIKKAFLEEFKIKDEWQLVEKMKAFNRHCTTLKKLNKTPKDYREHLKHWLTKQREIKNNGSGSNIPIGAPDRWDKKKGML